MSESSGASRTTVKPQVLKGFRDYLPEQMIVRGQVISTIRDVFEKHGFEPLDTPALEYLEVLTGKAGENEKLMYQFADQGGRDVGLRYDLTVPLSRVAAMHQNKLVMPFKRYHIAPVWRAEKPQRGRLREFWQCDVDVTGSSSMNADAEVVAVLADVLTAMNLPNFMIHISHRRLLERLAIAAGIDAEHAAVVYRSIDKLAKIGRAGVLAEMTDHGIDARAAESLLDVVDATEDSASSIERSREILRGDETGLAAVAELEVLLSLLPAFGVPPDRFRLDLTLARGLDYYTGPVFEATVTEPNIGSIAGGGRYDELIGAFLGRQVPATGLSLGLERLIEVVQEFGLDPIRKSVADVFIVATPANLAIAGEFARRLRALGVNADQSLLTNRSIGEQLKYADRRGIPLAVIAGEDELQRGIVTIKSLQSGQQWEAGQTELESEVQRLMNASSMA